jgi:hypothetical protein
MAKGKPEEHNPKRRPPRPSGLFVPLDSPIRKDEKEMRELSGIPQGIGSTDLLRILDGAEFLENSRRERSKRTSEIHDESYNQDKSSY